MPLLMLVVLVFALPESPQFQNGLRPAAAKDNPVSGLFADGLATSTLLLWAIFLISLLNLPDRYWLPTVLNLGGLTPSRRLGLRRQHLFGRWHPQHPGVGTGRRAA